MMDEIEMLIKRIKDDSEIRRTRFNSNFLENVGEVLERYGFEETRLFLLDKKSRYQLKYQATALLKVLDTMKDIEKIKRNRSIGRYVFKNMIAIKSLKEV
jgi:cysteinyl-tRNA synthetase